MFHHLFGRLFARYFAQFFGLVIITALAFSFTGCHSNHVNQTIPIFPAESITPTPEPSVSTESLDAPSASTMAPVAMAATMQANQPIVQPVNPATLITFTFQSGSITYQLNAAGALRSYVLEAIQAGYYNNIPVDRNIPNTAFTVGQPEWNTTFQGRQPVTLPASVVEQPVNQGNFMQNMLQKVVYGNTLGLAKNPNGTYGPVLMFVRYPYYPAKDNYVPDVIPLGQLTEGRNVAKQLVKGDQLLNVTIR